MNTNFFDKHKTVFTIFCTCAVFFILIAVISFRGLFFDAPAMFLNVIHNEESGQFYVYFVENRTRIFSSMLLALPYNFFCPFFNNLSDKLNLFAFSYIIMTFAAMLFNVFLAKRTNRYDIAIIAFAFYALGYLPGSAWFVREIYFAAMMQFALLQYFLSKEKMWKKDYLYIIFLSIFLFESFENEIVVGLILFIASIFYILKNKKEAIIKLFIGCAGLFAALYGSYKTVLSSHIMDFSHLTFAEVFQEYKSSFITSFYNINQGAMLISLFAIIFIAVSVFVFKKELNSKHSILGVFSIVFIFYLLWETQRFIPQINNEQHHFIMSLILIEPIMILLICLDYFDIKIKDFVYDNIFIVSCIAGILGCVWQINSCKYSLEYAINFKNKLTNAEGIVYFDDRDREQPFMTYDHCFGTLQRSLILTPDYEMKTIVFPDKKDDYYANCIAESFYDEENNSISLQSNYMPVLNKYHDLSAIVPYIQELEKEFTNLRQEENNEN